MKNKPFRIRESTLQLRLSCLKRWFKNISSFLQNQLTPNLQSSQAQKHINTYRQPSMTWVHTYDYAIENEFKTIKLTNNPILIFPTQSIKLVSQLSWNINTKRFFFFFLSGEEISRILGFTGPNRLLASIWPLVKQAEWSLKYPQQIAINFQNES